MNRNPNNPRKAVSARRLGWIAAFALIGSVAQAQQTSSPAPAAPQDEPLELSPFVVSAEQDHGYSATNSMAGTRLNTGLKDIAAAISVVTKDLMTDLNATNSAQLMTYTLSTEVSGASGSFSGAAVAPGSLQQDSPNRGFLPAVRIRGLANADNTRDFFLTDIPWDGFNTDRVEVNRGPNAMLFGTGSPAGIINQTTSPALVDKTKTATEFQYGSFGSTRATLDTNVVLIPEKLAIRAALKYSDERFQQEEAFIEDKRGFAAATYKPFKLTTLRANYEEGRQSSVKPQWRPPFDLGVQSWFDLGKPAVNPLTNMATLTGTATARVSAINPDGTYRGSWTANGAEPLPILTGNLGGGWGSDNPTLVFDNPDRLGTNMYGVNGVYALTNRGPGYWGGSLVGVVRSRQYQQNQHVGMVGAGAYNEQEISDPGIFDFYNHLLEGGNKTEGAKWHVFTATLEQLTPDRKGGIEFAYNHQYLRSSFNNPFNWETYGIGVDVNTVLLNGAPNPNFGRPYIASDSWSTESKATRDNMRATAFYTVEAKFGPDWLQKLLGKHTLTGNFSRQEAESVTSGGRALVAGPEWMYLNPQAMDHSNGYPYTIPNNAPRGMQTVVYLGNATTGNSAAGMNIQPISVDVMLPGIDSVPVYFYKNIYGSDDHPNAPNLGGSWQTAGVQILRGSEFDKSNVDLNWTGGATKSIIDSKVFVLHSSMFWDTIIPTIGWRQDDLEFYNAPANTVNSDGFSESKSPLPSSPSSTFEQESFNWGAVARLPKSLEAKLPWGLQPGIFYNSSDNFSPTAQRINIFGQNIDPSMGTTEEYGLIVSALNDKVSVRLTHYETAITGTSVDMRDAIHTVVRDGIGNALANISNGFNDANPVARDAFKNWWNTDPLAQNIKSTFGFVGDRPTAIVDGVLLQTSDSVSKGWELEVVYNPTQNWRLGFNATNQEVVNKNTATDAALFMNMILPALNGQAGQVWTDNTGRTWRNRANDFINAVNGKIYGDGQSANPELRQDRFNGFTNYSFSEGALKGFGVGGAVRYGSKLLIGTGYKRDANLGDIPDYGVLYYGPSETRWDAWVSYSRPNIYKNVNLDLQLNIRNIGVDEKLIPTVAQPDGSIAQWRIAEPMTWTLSARFSF